MSQLSTLGKQEGFGATLRRDSWWLGPALTVLGLGAFLIYGTWAAWQDGNFEIRQQKGGPAIFHEPGNVAVAPYLSPFYSPLLYDEQSSHAWFAGDWKKKLGLPSWFPFSAGFLILAFPSLFRLTCYYYRKAYYRSFWADPPGCAVGEPRQSYWGENHWPLLFQNAHRYFMYIAVLFLVILTYDALCAFWWPTFNEQGQLIGHRFGVGLGTLIMVVNVLALAAFTFGCNSVRHLVGGRLNCFSCPNQPGEVSTAYKLWQCSSKFNEHHMEWAWISLFTVGFVDVYIRLCSLGRWTDWRFF